MLIIQNSTETYAKREAGGKGYNLYLLSRQNFPVPQWVVLGASIFRAFRAATGLESKIAETVNQAKSQDLGLIASKVRELILSMPLPKEIEEQARQAYRSLSKPLIAVRSSAADEDSATHSFAGQLSTFLYVRSEDEALRCLKECWASGYSERGLSYRIQNDMDLSLPIQVAVIFQEMVDSEKSGVLFTCDPIKKDGTKITVNSVYGVGEGLVSGLLDADTFLIDKKTGKTLQQELVSKKAQLVMNASSPEAHTVTGEPENTHEVPVAEPLQELSSLSETELQALSELSSKVEKYYRFPQDIEWGMKEGKLYLLQSRPVTTPIQNEDGLLYIWDNSNIVESYGGLTLPLTFTFARNAYHWVYIQFCEILLIPQSDIRKMDYFLRNMLGMFYGRVFYNILNWYKLTSILPGFKYNRSFMETMMGTQHSLADEIADRIKPPGFSETLSSKVMRTISGLKFLWFHFTIQSMVDNFLEYFHEEYSKYRHINYSQLPADEIWALYQEVEQKMLMRWHAPIVNDYLCMVHFGILKKLTSQWLSHLGDALQNDLLCGEGNLESAEPTRELIRMAALISKNAGLKALIEATPAEDCLEAVQQSNYSEFKTRVARYIDLYGFRCMNEMKLEEKDLYQDPSFLFICLKNYLRSGQTDLDGYEKREHEIRAAAEKKVRESLSGLKLRVYLWSLTHARKAVKNRENTRFCRTRIYGVARAMFHGIGKDFTARGIIEVPEDIFYLEIQELAGALEGHLTVQEPKLLVELRKRQYESYASIEPSSRFLTRGPAYWMNEHTEPEKEVEEDPNLPPGTLKGVGCCPGKVEGIVKVILSPKDNMELNGEILVTLRTDPGWIPLYPAASALLVERGGLLSHSAIVAREMGLPTVVSLKGLTQKLKSGMRVRIDGETGVVQILESDLPRSES
jgi:phosphohistidine swiveling domain-containing protein